METPLEVFRQHLTATGEPLAAIRVILERFGLSLIQAKEVWVQVSEGVSLTEHQQHIIVPLESAFQQQALQQLSDEMISIPHAQALKGEHVESHTVISWLRGLYEIAREGLGQPAHFADGNAVASAGVTSQATSRHR